MEGGRHNRTIDDGGKVCGDYPPIILSSDLERYIGSLMTKKHMKRPWAGSVMPPNFVSDGEFFFINTAPQAGVEATGPNGQAFPRGDVSSLPGHPEIQIFNQI